MLESWKAIQDAINQQRVCSHMQLCVDYARGLPLCGANGEQPTVFILASGVVGKDGMGSEVSREACRHFDEMGFSPAPIIGLNVSENPILA